MAKLAIKKRGLVGLNPLGAGFLQLVAKINDGYGHLGKDWRVASSS